MRVELPEKPPRGSPPLASGANGRCALGGLAGKVVRRRPVRQPSESASAKRSGFDRLVMLDDELARVARSAGILRVRIGEALERFGNRAWHHELGFSSFEAYALERCERSGRWAAESRAVARRLRSLPRLCSAATDGRLSYCMVELLARHADPSTEAALIEQASQSSIRQMRALLKEPQSPEEDDEPELKRLSLTVSREQAWLFEATRWLVGQVEGRSSVDRVMHTLLAEGTSELIERTPRGQVAGASVLR